MKGSLYEHLTSDQIETNNPKIENNEDERRSSLSSNSLEYSPTGEYNTLNEPICTSLVSKKNNKKNI